MGLLQNRGWHNQCGVRFIGYGVFNVQANAGGHSTFFRRASFNRNLMAGEGIEPDLSGVPNGTRHPIAWIMPQKAGALAARRRILGAGTLTGAIAEGRNLAGTLAGTSTAEAILQLVVSGQATIAGTSTTDGNVVAALSGSGSAAGTSTCSATIGAKADLQVIAAGSSSCTGVPWGLGWVIADITPYTELSPQSLSDAVWSALLANYPDAGTAGNTLSLAGSGGVDYNTLAAAIVTALQADPETLTVPKFLGLQ